MARPKTKAQPKFPNSELVAEEKSCGYIMHQVKSIRCRMRWGELVLGDGADGMKWCQITLFKFDLVNPKLGALAKGDLKHKASFFFNEDNFCGLEKGQHITKHGTKRYICVILRDQHIIFQDAIIAMTNANHDIIQTWYDKITEAMHYMSRWRILETPDVKFLHVSKLNTSICLSLHNSNEGLKGKVITQQQHKTKSIENVEEQQGRQSDGSTCTHVSLFIRGSPEKLCLIVESGRSLSDVINKVNHTNPTSFDALEYQNPNLVRIPPKPKRPPRSLKELSDDRKNQATNNYTYNLMPYEQKTQFSNQQNEAYHHPGESRSQFTASTGLAQPMTRPNDSAPGQPFRPYKFTPPNPPMVPSRSRILPRDPNHDVKKLADTRVNVDSGYHTSRSDEGILSSGAPTSEGEVGPYVNMQEMKTPDTTSDQSYQSNQHPVSSPETNLAPAVPARDIPVAAVHNHERDLIENALHNQSLPPLSTDPNARLPGYENSLSTKVTIDLVLHRNHGENIDVSLGLPHSVYVNILLGLEMNAASGGDWRGLASELAMSFEDVQQIEAATQNRQSLYPAHVVLVHWSRTQAPYPFTRMHLRTLLGQRLARVDLAALIPLEENDSSHENEDN